LTTGSVKIERYIDRGKREKKKREVEKEIKRVRQLTGIGREIVFF
jgi:hypothetical protein